MTAWPGADRPDGREVDADAEPPRRLDVQHRVAAGRLFDAAGALLIDQYGVQCTLTRTVPGALVSTTNPCGRSFTILPPIASGEGLRTL